jgi:hypothetical protein
MEKKNKKLQLNKETIRNLSDESLEQVAGGKKKGESAVVGCITDNNKSVCITICNTGVSCNNKSCILC